VSSRRYGRQARLEPEGYTLAIEVLGKKKAASSDERIDVDAFAVLR
jgi:hypothetical protein